MSELTIHYERPEIDGHTTTSVGQLEALTKRMLEQQRVASHASVDALFDELQAENAAHIEAIAERQETGAITH